METIQLSKHSIPSMTAKNGQSSIVFKGNPVVGYVPLLKLFHILSGGHDYFRAELGHGVKRRVGSNFQFNTMYSQISFRRNMRVGSPNNPRATIVTSFLSVLGIQGDLQKLQSKIGLRMVNSSYGDYAKSRKGQHIFISNPVEVFILAMIKPSDLVKIDLTDKYTIDIDPATITLFLSEEKYHNRKYLNENYNRTIAAHLRNDIDSFVERYKVKTEIVPDEVLKQYYTNPYSIENNSIFEIMEIDKNIKDRVFSRIHEHLEIAE